MTDTSHTQIVAILDRSGSMAGIADDMVGGFNAFIAQQRALSGSCTVSLHQFDDSYETVYTGRPIDQVPSLVLQPRGTTALLDAIGRTINITREELAGLPESERPGTVIVVIMTDGHENASQEFTLPAVRQLIQAQEKADEWTFIYLGANQDAIDVASGLGVGAGQALTYSGPKTAAAWDSLALSVGAIRSSRRTGRSAAEAKSAAAFTDEQRKKAAE